MQIQAFELERYFAKYEFNTEYLLCSSDMESMSIEDLLSLDGEQERHLDSLKKVWLGYTESQGAPELREEIVKLYDKLSTDQVLVHAGAEEAIFNFVHAVLKPGDHVIVHYPCYQSLISVAESIGCEVTKWQADEANNWELDLNFLKDNIKANTKAVIVNCPHNPTGYLMSQDKQNDLVSILREKNILLFSDEVYRLLEYNEEERLLNAADAYENAVSLGVMSKSLGLAGLRIGWIATQNQEMMQAMKEFKDYTSICNSAPSEFLSIIALQNKEKIIARNLEIVNSNLKILDAFFEKHSSLFAWNKPKAGSIAFPKLLLDQSIDEFADSLVKEKNVLILPSTAYNYGDKNFRLGFGRVNMPEALKCFEEFLLLQKT